MLKSITNFLFRSAEKIESFSEELDHKANQFLKSSNEMKINAEIKLHTTTIDITKKEILRMDSFHSFAKHHLPDYAHKNPEDALKFMGENQIEIPIHFDIDLKLKFMELDLALRRLHRSKDELATFQENPEPDKN